MSVFKFKNFHPLQKNLLYWVILLGLKSPTAHALLEIEAKTVDEPTSIVQENTLRGCCGIAPDHNLRASSFLPSQGKNTYEIYNIVDDDLTTAWNEGQEGYGIGEYFEFDYEFEQSTGWGGYCDQVWIANGYQKSPEIWAKNSRVKTFLVSIEDQPFAKVNLKDVRGEQYFSLSFGRWMGKKTTVRIKFEINNVYPGKQWKDVAISELYFGCGP